MTHAVEDGVGLAGGGELHPIDAGRIGDIAQLAVVNRPGAEHEVEVVLAVY